MGIKTIEAAEVSCNHCPETIVVRLWEDAAQHGWGVPSEGHFQLCPSCLAKHKRALFGSAAVPDDSLAVKFVEATASVSFFDTMAMLGSPQRNDNESTYQYRQRIADWVLDQRDKTAEPTPPMTLLERLHVLTVIMEAETTQNAMALIPADWSQPTGCSCESWHAYYIKLLHWIMDQSTG